MPIGYLVTVAIVALGTLLALRPVRRPLVLGVVSWVFASLLNELPFIAFLWLLASTLSTASGGGIHSPGSWATVGLAALTTVGLAVVIRRALSTRTALDDALSEGLGIDWDSAPNGATDAWWHRRLPVVRILVGPLFFRRRDVQRIANISYGDAGRKNLLDIYRNSSNPTGAPVLVHLHGGALFMGKKNREARSLLYQLASHGWVCISANYRLRPAAHFPDHLIDVKKVVAWVRANGEGFGADPSVLFLAGSSSGAQLTALAALTPNDPAFQPGFEDIDTSITAAICMHGYYGNVDSAEPSPASPLAYDATNAPPFLVVHGELDSVVPVEAARAFVGDLLVSSLNPVVYAELPGGHHGFDRFHSIRFDSVVDGIEAFAGWVNSGGGVPQPPLAALTRGPGPVADAG
jgi:acetyl esterase/lipase